MNWDAIFAQYTALYQSLAGIPMTPLRRGMAEALLRNRSVEEIRRAVEAITLAGTKEGKTAVQLMTKFENGSWQPPS